MAKLLTSITESQYSKFKSTSVEREQLGCTKITGFFLLRLKKGMVYRLRYTDLAGKRRTATIASGEMKPQQAAEIALEWKAKQVEGIDPLSHKEALRGAQKAEQETLANEQYVYVGRYFEAIYTPYLKTYLRDGQARLNIIKNNFEHLFNRRMDQIKKSDITDWYNKRRANGIARSTLQRDCGAFKAMLNHAAAPVDDAAPLIELNPIARVGLPKMTIAEKEAERTKSNERSEGRDMLSDQNKKAIELGLARFAEKAREQRRRSRKHGKPYLADLNAVAYPHWFIPFTYIAWLTGIRPGDIRTLKWEQLEHNRFSGATTLFFTPAKTQDKGENPVQVKFPVSGRLANVLDQWQAQQGNPKKGFIFTSERTGQAMDKTCYRRPWAEVKKLAGISESLDFYSFRHNFISELVAKGLPVLTIAGLVGHRDGTMIAKNYLRHDEHSSADILAELGASMGGIETVKKEGAA